MDYQNGIVPVIQSKDFSIYRNLFYSGVASPLSNISLVAGGYTELEAMAYGGINLSQQAEVFPSDVPPTKCAQYINRTYRIYTPSMNALDAIALQCLSSSVSNPLKAIAPANSAWISGQSSLGTSVVDSWPGPIAVTSVPSATLDLPINGGGCGESCAIWLPVRLSGDGGLLSFRWGTSLWSLNTSQGYHGVDNAMVWVSLPFEPISGSDTLEITSDSGRNAVGEAYVAPPGPVTSWIQNLTLTKEILIMAPGADIQLPIVNKPGQSDSHSANLKTIDAIDRSAIYLQALGAMPLVLNLTLPAADTGFLSLLVRAIATGTLVIGGPQGQILGFDTGDYSGMDNVMSWIRVPVTASEYQGDNLSIRIANGSVLVSEVSFTPVGTFRLPGPSEPPLTLEAKSSYFGSATKFVNYSIDNSPDGISSVSGQIKFSNVTYYAGLGGINFAENISSENAIALRYNVSPGLLLELDGIKVGGVGIAQWTQLNSSFYYGVLRSTYGAYVLDFEAYENASKDTVNASFSISIVNSPFYAISNVSDLSNLSPSATGWTSEGYDLSDVGGSLVYVRIPYSSNLEIVGSGGTLLPSLGSADSLLWATGKASQVDVESSSLVSLELGFASLAVTFCAWVGVEFIGSRHRPGIRRRTGANGRYGEQRSTLAWDT